MHSESVQSMGSEFENLAAAFRGIVEWKWDGRFKVALGEFPVDVKDDVRGILDRFLPFTWNASNVKKAPDAVQQVTKSLGGLMSGQLLFLSDSTKAAFIFCAWWPWGNGTRISIRLAPVGVNLTDEERADLMTAFRGWFKI
jgi:hypothetical protein